jgi:hypothetical protein
MKTKKELQNAVNEINEVCKKHGIVLVGVENGGMIGKISISDSNPDDSEWLDLHKVIRNNINEDNQLSVIGEIDIEKYAKYTKKYPRKKHEIFINKKSFLNTYHPPKPFIPGQKK